MDKPTTGQFHLLTNRRFLPFFLTQFLGAFNDNVFKNALILLVAFSVIEIKTSSDVIINFAAMLFILPFFLFSATAGLLADKMEKSRLIRRIKLLEVAIMGLAAWAFYCESLAGLLAVLFLMGTQSTFFGPVKYALIPQHLTREELVGGNALVEAGTFIAIILGTIAANVFTDDQGGGFTISIAVMIFAALGLLTSFWIPQAEAAAPEAKIHYNIVAQTGRVISFALQDKSVFLAILGVSWFWLLGAAYLTQMANYVQFTLNGSADAVTLALVLFSLGIGVGSLFCERFSGHKLELGLVPFGSLGLSIFGIDLYFASSAMNTGSVLELGEFIQQPGIWRILIDLGLIGLFAGFYVVPLFAMIQARAPFEHRAQVIAAANIFNALFMVVGALLGMLVLGVAGLTITEFFLILACLNIAVAIYIYRQVPEFAMRFLVWVIGHIFYRLEYRGLANIPKKGPAVLVCNHVSYMDAVLLAGACPRAIRFVVHKPLYNLPVLNFIFRIGKAIPIVSQKVDKQVFDNAFQAVADELEGGHLVCIFPEGRLTTDGEIGEFKRGVERILEDNPVPVVPIALQGLWGSFFSHYRGPAMRSWTQRFRAKVTLNIGVPVLPAEVSADQLYLAVKGLRGENT